MKTQQLLDKYRRVLAGLLDGKLNGVLPDDIHFETLDNGSWVSIGEDIYDKVKDEHFVRDWCLGRYRMKIAEEVLASWELYRMPHCCGIAVSCNAFVLPSIRGLRVGSMLNGLRQEIARGLGYSLLLCTDIAQNEHQRKLLRTQGWKDLHDFVNRRTGNRVYICGIGL